MQNNITQSLVWKFLERFSVQFVQFFVSIIIARLLMPEEYGIMAILSIFITLSATIVQSGLGAALIQKKEVSVEDFSTVLYYSLSLAFLLYILLFFLSPHIALFFKQAQLEKVLKIASLILFLGALNSVQLAYVSRNLLFHKLFIASLISVLISGGIGIIMAYYNYGVWALVGQQLSYQLGICILLKIMTRMKILFQFSFSKAKYAIKFGLGILLADLVDKLYHNLENIIIGKNFSSSTLAFFDRGKQFPLILINNIDGSIQSVMFPSFAKCQENLFDLKQLLRKSIRMSTFLSFSAMSLLFSIAPFLIQLLLGEKWMGCVPFLQLYCIITMLFPMQTANIQAYNAIGNSKLYLQLISIKRAVGTILLLAIAIYIKDVFAIVWTCFILELFAIIINLYPNKKILKYSIKELFLDILPNILIVINVLCIDLLCSKLISIPSTLSIFFLQVIIGGFIIILTALLTKNPSFLYIVKYVIKK